jgi:hypothetical protein
MPRTSSSKRKAEDEHNEVPSNKKRKSLAERQAEARAAAARFTEQQTQKHAAANKPSSATKPSTASKPSTRKMPPSPAKPAKAKPSPEVQRAWAKQFVTEMKKTPNKTMATLQNDIDDEEELLNSPYAKTKKKQSEEPLPPGFGSNRRSKTTNTTTTAKTANTIIDTVSAQKAASTSRKEPVPTSKQQPHLTEIVYEQPPPEALSWWTILFLVLAGFAAFATSLMLLQNPADRHAAMSPPTKLPPCFVDSLSLNDIPETPNECDVTLDRIPCPDFGLCAGGRLISCRVKHFEVSPEGRSCILTKASNDTLARVEALLVNWTVADYCHLSGNDFAHSLQQSKAALFPLSKVQKQVPSADRLLVSICPNVQVQNDHNAGQVVIGLSNAYVDTQLRLPFSCWMTLSLLEMGQHAWTTTLSIVAKTFYFLLKISMAYPIPSAIALLVLWLLMQLRRALRYRKRLIQDVVKVRDLCYQKLMVDPSLEHMVLHLRDGIAMDMYPSSRVGRAYIITKVWPKVVVDVRQDNRVAKYSGMVGDKPRDIWKWVATGQKTKGG